MLELSLLPLDVGFDLKLTPTPVVLTHAELAVKYLDAAGRPAVASGPRAQVVVALEAAGYVIASNPNSDQEPTDGRV